MYSVGIQTAESPAACCLPPTIGPDKTIYATSHEGSLFAIDRDGKIKWSFKTGDRSWSTPAVVNMNGKDQVIVNG